MGHIGNPGHPEVQEAIADAIARIRRAGKAPGIRKRGRGLGHVRQHLSAGFYAAAAPSPFSRSLPMALLRARESVMVRFRPMLRAHGLTEQQWRVLRAMAAVTHRLRPMELSQATYISMPSLRGGYSSAWLPSAAPRRCTTWSSRA